jgi:glycosyltransferase involved in cell wall biosynthesis
MKTIFLSTWFNFHYDIELANHLELRGVEVEKSLCTTFFLNKIVKGKASILHIHELHPCLLGKNKITKLIRTFIFAIQVYTLNLFGIKTIWTVHEWSPKFYYGEITPLQSAILGNCFHAIITHCETTRREIEKAFRLKDKNNVFLIPHANYLGVVENTVSQQEAREDLGIPQDNIVFLIFGYIYPHKGHIEAIEAFQKLEQDRTFLVIAGEIGVGCIELKEQIEEKIKGWQNILLIPERIPDEKIQLYMNACDCVVMPYKIFTTSGVALLAMSFKRACIAPNKDFFNDIISASGGFLYDPSQEDGLLQAMKAALKNKNQLADMGQYNFNQAKQWNWDAIAEKTFQIYIN